MVVITFVLFNGRMVVYAFNFHIVVMFFKPFYIFLCLIPKLSSLENTNQLCKELCFTYGHGPCSCSIMARQGIMSPAFSFVSPVCPWAADRDGLPLLIALSWGWRGFLLRPSPRTHLHVVGMLRLMFLTWTSRACPLLFILFLCLFLSLWPFQLYFIP